MADSSKTQAAGTPKKDVLKTDLATFFKLGAVAPKEYAKVFDPEDNDGYVLPKGVTASGIESEAADIPSNDDKLAAAHARLEALKNKKRQRDTSIEDAEEKHVRKSNVKKPKKVEEVEDNDEEDVSDSDDDHDESDAEMDVDNDGSESVEAEDNEEEAKEKVPLTEEEQKREGKRLARQAARKRKAEARAAERDAAAKSRAEAGDKAGKKKMTAAEKEEQDSRTLFIGNVPINADKNALRKIFAQYGTVESLRFRSITVNNPDKRLKSIIKQDLHPERDSMVAYIVFDSEACIKPALKANGVEFGGKHLRVDSAKKTELTTRDYINCVYVSGLPYGAEEEDLREIFQRCGTITNIRIVRDNHYKAAKGFGYVRFSSLDGMNAAIDLNLKINYKNSKLTVVKAISPESIKLKKAANASKHYRKPTSLTDKFKSKSKKFQSSKRN